MELTRAEMAEAVKIAAFIVKSAPVPKIRQELLDFAAAELRKSCAGCRHWGVKPPFLNVHCIRINGPAFMPADGSGYCRPGWEAK